ncbi:hypothetical protein C8R47DRAFT_980624 [Mycena vitilis]|nr:hypothetical protein C8R47DRAFT_980624 [Mycena vitilis]
MSRSRRSKSQASAAAEGLSVLDKLVLAQAVWEVGPGSWLKISRLLGKHPLLTHPKTFFTAQSCHAMYNHLMKEAGFELSDANNAVHGMGCWSQFECPLKHVTAPTHLKLAEKFYQERVEELRSLIGAEEQQFKAIVAEIDQIRAGQRDEELKAKITGVPDPVEVETHEPQAEAIETVDQEEPATIIPGLPPPSEADMEDVLPHLEEAKSTETSPAPEVPYSPAENLDHLMQVSDDEKAPEVEVPDSIPEEQPVVSTSATTPEEAIAPVPAAEPTADNVKLEPVDAQNDEEDMDQSPSKPVSRNSEASGAPETGPAEEVISTRRMKRGRRPLQKPTPVPTPEPEAEIEQQSTPAPTVSEPTPAVDETQAEEEPPLSAAVRRRESTFSTLFTGSMLIQTGKRKASFFGGVDSPRASKRAREDSEPVDDDEQGNQPLIHLYTQLNLSVLRRRPTGRTEEQVALKRFQTVITMVHSQISQHRNGNIFHNPIKVSEAPDYHDIVKRPIDLKTIKAKIKDGVIGNSLEYQRDIYLMFANAMMYNRPGSDVHVMAEDMMVESDSHINTFRQTEGYVSRPRA